MAAVEAAEASVAEVTEAVAEAAEVEAVPAVVAAVAVEVADRLNNKKRWSNDHLFLCLSVIINALPACVPG